MRRLGAVTRPRLTRRAPAWLVLLLIAGPVRPAGAEANVEAALDRSSARVGDPVTLRVIIEGGSAEGEPLVGESADYDAYYIGQSQKFTFVNGEFSSSTVYNFRVVPKKEGKLSVGPVRVRVGGKDYETKPIDLVVQSGAAPQQRPRSPSPPGTGTEESRVALDEGLFVTTAVDRDTVYIHQQVTLTFRYYQSIDAFVINQPSYVPPSTTGFLKEDLGDQKQFTVRRQGRVYKVTEMQTALFPTQTGRLRIGGAEVECVVEDRSRRARDPFSLFRRGLGDRKVTLHSEAVDVMVLPLPRRNQPEDFEGAVGRFTLRVEADTNAIRANEPVTIRAEITGPGSVTTLGDLELNPPDGVRLFDSGLDVQSRIEDNQVLADKTTTWILVPDSPRPLTIPPLSLTYFDPEERRYLRTESGPITVDVLPGSAPDLVTSGGAPPAVVGRDIRFLKTELTGLSRGESSGPLGRAPWIHVAPILALAGAWVVHGRRKRLESDAAGMRRNLAVRRARRRLREMAGGPAPARVIEVVEGYLADRIDGAPGAPRTRLLGGAAAAGLSSDLVEAARRFLEECDRMAFTPRGTHRPRDLAGAAGSLLDRLEAGFRGS